MFFFLVLLIMRLNLTLVSINHIKIPSKDFGAARTSLCSETNISIRVHIYSYFPPQILILSTDTKLMK